MVRDIRCMHRRGNGSIKLVLFLVLAVGGLGAWKMLSPSATWYETIDDGLEVAEREQKPILILFTAGWCPPCQKLKREVLADSEVKGYLGAEFVLVKVDLSDESGPNNEVAFEHGVKSIPTIKAYDRHGDYVDTYDGTRTKADFLGWAQRVRG